MFLFFSPFVVIVVVVVVVQGGGGPSGIRGVPGPKGEPVSYAHQSINK